MFPNLEFCWVNIPEQGLPGYLSPFRFLPALCCEMICDAPATVRQELMTTSILSPQPVDLGQTQDILKLTPQ